MTQSPLTPADCDLRGMEWMPLYGGRLFGSDFDAHASDAEFRAGMQLWWAAWNQVPAASLPNDDVALCRLAGLGRDLKAWRKARDRALSGFVLCSDGRLYHKALAVFANESWERRLKSRKRKEEWRNKRDRSGDGDVPETVPERGQDGDKGCDGAVAERSRQDRTGQDATRRDVTRPKEAEEAAAAFAAFQAAADAEGWPNPQFMNSTRQFQIEARLRECGGRTGWDAVLVAAKNAGFLKGADGRWQRWFDIDWLLKPENFTRLMEGRYAERHASKQQSGLTGALAGLA